MTAREAVLVALDAETKAHDHFAAPLPHISNPEVKALFEE
jgi:hypothetical protein